MFTILRFFFIFKVAANLISIENSLSAEIGQRLEIGSAAKIGHWNWMSKLAFTYLGHLGQYDTIRIISIDVALPKVAKASKTGVLWETTADFADKLCQCSKT
jgi:hypothetical protein